MFIAILHNTIIGLFFGNIRGLFKRLISKGETPLWTSNPYFKNLRGSDPAFAILWALIAAGIGYALLAVGEIEARSTGDSTFGLFNIIPAFFFVTGCLLLLQCVHWFDRIKVYPDRIVLSVLFDEYKVIPKENVHLIIRTKSSRNYVEIFYEDTFWGLTSLGGKQWRIPSSMFKSGEILESYQQQVHANVLANFDDIKGDLPDKVLLPSNDIKSPVIKTLGFSLLVINPYVVTILLVFIFGVFKTSFYFLFVADISGSYFSTILKYVLRQQIDPQYLMAKVSHV